MPNDKIFGIMFFVSLIAIGSASAIYDDRIDAFGFPNYLNPAWNCIGDFDSYQLTSCHPGFNYEQKKYMYADCMLESCAYNRAISIDKLEVCHNVCYDGIFNDHLPGSTAEDYQRKFCYGATFK